MYNMYNVISEIDVLRNSSLELDRILLKLGKNLKRDKLEDNGSGSTNER